MVITCITIFKTLTVVLANFPGYLYLQKNTTSVRGCSQVFLSKE